MATQSQVTAAQVLDLAIEKHGEGNVRAEQLGAVYEAIQPMEGRKRTGVFYTPREVARFMGRVSLEQAIRSLGPEPSQLLRIKVVDPACGCGILLTEAAQVLATHYAGRLFGGQPDETRVMAVLPTVILWCIFGVDLDPVSAELTRVALSLETAGVLPAEALNRHIVAGNTLAGDMPPALDDFGPGPGADR